MIENILVALAVLVIGLLYGSARKDAGFKKGKLCGFQDGYDVGFRDGRLSARTVTVAMEQIKTPAKTAKKVAKKKSK